MQAHRIELRPGLLDKLSNGGEAIVAQLQVTIARVNELLGPRQSEGAELETLVSLNQAAQTLNKVTAQASPTLQRLPATVDSAHVRAEFHQHPGDRLQLLVAARAKPTMACSIVSTTASNSSIPRRAPSGSKRCPA
jgi:hypothetical protein